MMANIAICMFVETRGPGCMLLTDGTSLGYCTVTEDWLPTAWCCAWGFLKIGKPKTGYETIMMDD